MLYRTILGLVPLALAACSSPAPVPGSGTAEAAPAADRGGGPPRAAVTPGQVGEVFSEVDASLEAEIKRRAPEEKRRNERLRRERLKQQGLTDDWAPAPGGWGR